MGYGHSITCGLAKSNWAGSASCTVEVMVVLFPSIYLAATALSALNTNSIMPYSLPGSPRRSRGEESAVCWHPQQSRCRIWSSEDRQRSEEHTSELQSLMSISY